MKLLQYSGGLDSLACLLLLQDVRDLHVLTVLTDGAYPEAEDDIERVSREFPGVEFHVHNSKREIERYGQPVDVVPLRWTSLGQLIRGGDDVRYQDSFSCCQRAIWEPLDRISRRMGATVIYRGQRNDDRLRAPVRDGDIDRGITMRFPVATWSRQRVIEYVADKAPGLVPLHYHLGERTSRDCMDCTAYLEDNQVRLRHLPMHTRERVNGLIMRWRADVIAELGA